jgi:hypothetical protein
MFSTWDMVWKVIFPHSEKDKQLGKCTHIGGPF